MTRKHFERRNLDPKYNDAKKTEYLDWFRVTLLGWYRYIGAGPGLPGKRADRLREKGAKATSAMVQAGAVPGIGIRNRV
jgi:hypothetical protein